MTRRSPQQLPAVSALAARAPGPAVDAAARADGPVSLDATAAGTGAHGPPDLASALASLASAAVHLASRAQQLAELLAAGAESPTSGLALLARHEQSREPMDEATAPAATPALMLTKRQAAALLGVHPRTLDRMRAAGEGPKAIRVRGAVRYRRRDVERWLEGKRS